MPITQSRLHTVVRAAQELAETITATKDFIARLAVPDLVAQLNSAAERSTSGPERTILGEAVATLMATHNAVQDMQIGPETLITLAEERTHYRLTAKQNIRQAAYQRRKRAEGGPALGKGITYPSPDDTDIAPLALSQDLQDYLDGKLATLPPAQGYASSERASFITPHPPAHVNSERASVSIHSERASVNTAASLASPAAAAAAGSIDGAQAEPPAARVPGGAAPAFDTRGKDVL